jgi:hypothetical protein
MEKVDYVIEHVATPPAGVSAVSRIVPLAKEA